MQEPVHNWQHMQQIKNDISGEVQEGVELLTPQTNINFGYFVDMLGL